MRYYNSVSNVFDQDNSAGTHVYIKRTSRAEYRSRLPHDGWVKINVDVSKRHWIKSTWIEYVMRDHHSEIVMTKSRRIGDCAILLAEYWLFEKRSLRLVRRVFNGLLSEVTLSWLWTLITGKISISKDIVNLIEDINCLRSLFKDSTIEYCNGLVNREVDGLVKRSHRYP